MAGLSDEDLLEAELKAGSQEVFVDAVGQRIARNLMPIGVPPPGKTLVQFWHLDFWGAKKPGMPDYAAPLVQQLLRDMLSIRRLDPHAVRALMERIQKQLLDAYGTGAGGMMAAMLISRSQDALNTPEDFPPLLDDAELKQAFVTAMRLEGGFKAGGALVGAGKTAGAKAGAVETARAAPGWLQRMAGAFGRATTGKVPNLSLLWAGFMASRGQAYFSAKAQDYRDELNRRRLPIPSVI